jgi:hypothetical protein
MEDQSEEVDRTWVHRVPTMHLNNEPRRCRFGVRASVAPALQVVQLYMSEHSTLPAYIVRLLHLLLPLLVARRRVRGAKADDLRSRRADHDGVLQRTQLTRMKAACLHCYTAGAYFLDHTSTPRGNQA